MENTTESNNDNNNTNISELEKLLTNKDQLPSRYIDKITDKIYLGDYEGTKDLDYFSKEGITHVLSIINDILLNFLKRII